MLPENSQSGVGTGEARELSGGAAGASGGCSTRLTGWSRSRSDRYASSSQALPMT